MELKIAEYQTEFYESVYVNREEDVNKKMGDWIAKKKTGNIKTEEYTFEITGSTAPYTVTIKKDNTLKEDIVGSLTEDGILSWTSSGGGTTYTAYSVGDEVTLKSDSNEHFYVIKASGEDEEKVTLLAKKNIDTTSFAQSDGFETVAFCSNSTYSSLGNDLTSVESLNDDATIIEDATSAVYYARKYAERITGNEEDGRLILYDEANTLKASYSSMIYGTETRYLNYWLGSAEDTDHVWIVIGERSLLGRDYFNIVGHYGVRPVIEISKSLIQE